MDLRFLNWKSKAAGEFRRPLHWDQTHDQSTKFAAALRCSAKRIRGEWFELAPEHLVLAIEFLKQHDDLNHASVDYEWLGKISLKLLCRGVGTVRYFSSDGGILT